MFSVKKHTKPGKAAEASVTTNTATVPGTKSKESIKDSGDALEDDFQASDTEYLSDGQDGGEAFGDDDVYDNDNGEQTTGNKRKGAPSSTSSSAEPSKKKKNNKKPKSREENNTPIGKRSKASQIEYLNDSQDRALEHLSSIERDEQRIPEQAIKDNGPFALDHTLVHLESFLKFAVTGWKSKLMVKDISLVEASSFKKDPNEGKKLSAKAMEKAKKEAAKKEAKQSSDLPKGAPIVLILSASGIRSVEIIRSLPLFAKSARIGKLFAKHLKVPEQVQFLESTATHISVGTPNRVDKLIDMEALRLDRLELILLDCHKDGKKRTILDIQEIRVDLFKMLNQAGIQQRFASGACQLAMF